MQLNAVHLPLSLSRGIIASKAQSTIPMQERTAKIHSTHMFKTELFLCAQTVPSSLQSRPGFPSYEMGHNIISPTMSPAPYPSSSCGDFLTHPTPTPRVLAHCGQAWRHGWCVWCLLVIPDGCIFPADVRVVAGGVKFAVHGERVVAVSFGHHFSAAPAIDLLCWRCHGGGWRGCVTVAAARGGVVLW